MSRVIDRPSDQSGDSILVGLWVLLVINGGQISTLDSDSRVPMMARTGGDQTYLLGFKNMSNARKFLQESEIEGAEPRMVVKGNVSQFLQIAREAGAVGVLVDYNPATQDYASAATLSQPAR